MTRFALVHSPLVGPSTWSPVAAVLGSRAIIPMLSEDGRGPFWRRHAESVAHGIRDASDVVLVAHSGAGPLLPAIAERLARRPVGYLFVDAGIPKNGLSRLELMGEEDAVFAKGFAAYLNGGGSYPNWSDEDLRPIVPDEALRGAVIAEMQPRGVDFFSEAIPVFSGWPDAPCGYVRLSAAYDRPFAHAQALGWPWRRLDAGHFHMLVEPRVVARAIVDVAAEMMRR